jgi:hypothetical protein
MSRKTKFAGVAATAVLGLGMISGPAQADVSVNVTTPVGTVTANNVVQSGNNLVHNIFCSVYGSCG